MDHPEIFIFSLFFLILFLFIYALSITSKNKLISFRVYRTPLEEEMLKYQSRKKMVDCKSYCTQEICSDYDVQKIYYDLCKECAKEFQCYDPYQKKCIPCKKRQSCETMFGCNNNQPLNPVYNACKKCWPKIIYG